LRCSVLLGLFLLSTAVSAQTTQGLISGRLLNSVTGTPIQSARIVFASSLTTLAGGAASDSSGYYLLPLLSPGLYQIRVSAEGFQAQEVQDLELTVAARIDLDFRLRPLNDVWEAGQYKSVFLPGAKTIVTFYGPDVDSTKTGSFEAQKGRTEALESTISEVINSAELDNLPLEGRDVFTMLVTQPGVTSDAGTARGLGLSINGTRPTSSNFMLDGVENNNYLTTGPLTPIAPEAIQEYRISTNNFSAEYGRTGGYVANAITRSGSDQFHGMAYFYLKNDALNANSFQQNLNGAPRTPDKELQPGYVVGGPILKNRLFFSSAFEQLSSHSFQGPATFLLPSTTFLSVVSPNSAIANLLTMFPAPAVSDQGNLLATLTVAPPVKVERSLGIERLDYTTPSGRDRIMARGIFVNMSEPDFIWSPYKAFITPLIEDTWAVGGSYIHTFSSSLTNEFRLSRTDDDLHFNRPQPQIPTLLAPAPSNYYPISTVTLPGSEQFYSYQNHSKTTELLDNLIWARDRHLITVGAGILFRHLNGYLTAGQDGEYTFDGPFDLLLDQPSSLTVTVERNSPAGEAIQPNYNREYAYNQYFLFAQDTLRLTPRLTVNFGVRYENYGSPRNVGPNKDALLQLGSGANLNDQLAGATLATPASGSEQLFGTDNLNIAVRVGASYDLFGTGRTLLRGGFGTFYDRPFDNLWQDLRSNDYVLTSFAIPGSLNYLSPISSVLSGLAQNSPPSPYAFPNVTLVAPNLLNGRTSSYFAGIQHRVTNDFTIEVNGLGTYGRNLITTDVINRQFTTLDGNSVNPNLPDVNYRANQGFSNYNALTVVARYRWSRGYLQGSYTWSHYIDNQSDPLAGDFFDLSFTNITSGSGTGGQAAFTQQFNPKSDIGNSDYDQRHNLVVFSYWNLPTVLQGTKAGVLFRGWIVSGLAAFRAGLPYTVIDNGSPVIPGDGTVINPRPDLVLPNAAVLSSPIPIPGGKQLLNPAAFAGVSDTVGTLGRNSLIGPGIYNIDLSVGRSFGVPWFGEQGRLTLRADAFNFLNHANLNNPDPLLGDTLTFGAASFGRLGDPSGFPAVSPLNETPREIQLLLRVEF
jgi:Carboxypeptidase regulatory-like domain/TonB-dependent Receptor Plug Domain/TonB dependent receptor